MDRIKYYAAAAVIALVTGLAFLLWKKNNKINSLEYKLKSEQIGRQLDSIHQKEYDLERAVVDKSIIVSGKKKVLEDRAKKLREKKGAYDEALNKSIAILESGFNRNSR